MLCSWVRGTKKGKMSPQCARGAFSGRDVASPLEWGASRVLVEVSGLRAGAFGHELLFPCRQEERQAEALLAERSR
jgi:hypothetical protein